MAMCESNKMTTRVVTSTQDWNSDGAPDFVRTETFTFQVDKLMTLDVQATDSASHSAFTYGASGHKVHEDMDVDRDPMDGVWDHRVTNDWQYDTAGRVTVELLGSPDFDGDGIPGDYKTLTGYTYDAAGRMTAKETDYFSWGQQMPSDYRDERWVYDAAGKLKEHRLDDPGLYDCEINKFYAYRTDGKLGTVRLQNEIWYGDDRARIVESYGYEKSGAMKFKTEWSSPERAGFARVDTLYGPKSADYDSHKIVFDVTGDGWGTGQKAEQIDLVENWYSGGNVTRTLVSHDQGGDGTIDSQDLFTKSWESGDLYAEVHDIGADGIAEYTWTSQLLVA